MMEVVKKLDLNKKIYAKGRIHNTQYYPIDKAPIKINFLVSDTLVYESKLSFSINILSETSFNFIRSVGGEEKEPRQEYFGKNVNTRIGDILMECCFNKSSG